MLAAANASASPSELFMALLKTLQTRGAMTPGFTSDEQSETPIEENVAGIDSDTDKFAAEGTYARGYCETRGPDGGTLVILTHDGRGGLVEERDASSKTCTAAGSGQGSTKSSQSEVSGSNSESSNEVAQHDGTDTSDSDHLPDIASSAGKGDFESVGESLDGACGVKAQIDFVESITNEWYLWYADLDDVEKSSFQSAQAYLEARMASTVRDGRGGFSYLTTITEDESRNGTGAYVGFGFRLRAASTRLFTVDVFENSPAWLAGVRRGMEIIAIDTGQGFETVSALLDRNADTAELLGLREVGLVRRFRFLRDGESIDIALKKQEVSPPALAGEPLLIEKEGLPPIGYLHLRQFSRSAITPEDGNPSLTDATRLFREAKINDLIVDLRYNGGGLIKVADTLMDLVAGIAAEDRPSFKLRANDQQLAFNNDVTNWGFFNALPESFSPIRVAFITSAYTASASEMVINGLHPHVEVVLVGGNTYGKQVGQGRWDMHKASLGVEREDCDVALRLTAFEFVNGENMGGYHRVGLAGTGRFTMCPARDDLTVPLGDHEEEMLATALNWFEHGACKVQASGAGNGVSYSLRKNHESLLDVEYIPGRRDSSLW